MKKVLCIFVLLFILSACDFAETSAPHVNQSFNEREWLESDLYLPIGSVVSLDGIGRDVMIIGYLAVPDFNPDTVRDYMGVWYPEGYLTADDKLLFNRYQITNILHLGYIDEPMFNLLQDRLIEIKEENNW